MVVKLPPLRDRTDLETVVAKILATESEGGPYVVSDEVLRLFRQHKWPGNFRQLTNLLRTAVIMAGDEGEIGMRHMPDDFLDDIDQSMPAAPLAAAERLIAEGIVVDYRPGGGIRVGAHFFNTIEELDRLVQAMRR